MKKTLFLIIILLTSCSSTKNTSIENKNNIKEVYVEDEELKEEVSSLKKEIQKLIEQQRIKYYRQQKRSGLPETLTIWIKIKNGKIQSNKIGYYNLPGRIIFDEVKRTSNGQAIVYLKNTHSYARWYFYAPIKDGEYTIIADLLE